MHDDDCWVPHMHVVTRINTPPLFSVPGRQYHISTDYIEVIENLIQVCVMLIEQQIYMVNKHQDIFLLDVRTL